MMQAVVQSIISKNDNITEVLLNINHPLKKAVNYNDMTGSVKAGDTVIVNTTAGTLGLGTGGYHFIIINLSADSARLKKNGHGMKLRYTPMQLKVAFFEEESKTDIYNEPLNLDGVSVLFCELHSMLPPLCAYLKYYSKKDAKIAYIMTDHGALPLKFSKNVAELREKNLLDGTITFGNAFGGDYECVNIYTALQTALKVIKSKFIIIAMGPGIVGTGTKYGFSGLESGLYYNLAKSLKGRCYFVPRIGFGDSRERHRGISHHFFTVINDIITSPVEIVFPVMNNEQLKVVKMQLKNEGIYTKHRIRFLDGRNITDAMKHFGIYTKTMGRSVSDDPLYFYGIGAVAKAALLSNNVVKYLLQ